MLRGLIGSSILLLSVVCQIPALAVVRSDSASGTSVVLGQVTTIPDQVATVPDQVTTVLYQDTTVPDEVTTVSDQAITVPDPVTTVPDQVTTVSDQDHTVPGQDTTVSDKVTTVSDQDPTVSDQDTTVPDPVTTVSDPVTTVPDQVTTVPDQVTTVSYQDTTVPDQVTVEPGVNRVDPVFSASAPTPSGAPGQADAPSSTTTTTRRRSVAVDDSAGESGRAVDDDYELTVVRLLADLASPRLSQFAHGDCWYDPNRTASLAAQSVSGGDEPLGCHSCELDDADSLLSDLPPLDIEVGQAAVDNQVPVEGLDHLMPRPVLRQLLQASLLRGGTFGAEHRHRRRPPAKNVTQVVCKCRVIPGETVCTLETGFCDALPRTDVPSGTLEVCGTNISYLDADSLQNFRSVCVLRLESNQLASIDDGTFAGMSRLHNLSLSYNRLEGLGAGALAGASNLLELLVSYNMFTNLTRVTRALTVGVTPSLLHLSAGGNSFPHVRRQDFAAMKGAPLQDLQLHENDIQHIDPQSFSDLRHLKRLRLRHNPLQIQELSALITELRNTALEMIDISMIGKYSLFELKPVLNAIAVSNVAALQLDHYCFPVLMKMYFPEMARLRVLTLAFCNIAIINPGTFDDFTSLEQLDLRDNYLTVVPEAVVLPRLRSLDLSRAMAVPELKFNVYQYRFREMRNLRFLDLSNNIIQTVDRGAFVGLENVTVLILTNTSISSVADFTFSMMENLSELYLSNNSLGNQSFEYTWQGLTKLKTLFIDNCNISTSSLYLSEMPRLEVIKLNNNFLRGLTAETFDELESLTAVDLSGNSLVAWNATLFGSAANLSRMYLHDNRITWVTSAMIEDFRNVRVLTLRRNPYTCDCRLQAWLVWEQQHGVTFNTSVAVPITTDVRQCRCQLPPAARNLTVMEFYSTSGRSPCDFNGLSKLLIMIPALISGMVMVVGGRAAYRSRWYVRYWLFKLTSKHWLKKLRKDSSGYLYDAFVSYSNEDAGFILDMIDNLEKTTPFYRLCVYERDFEIGNVISECILESINTSRKTILILTDHFAKSHWCRWEMNLVQCRLFEQTRDDLILVKLGKIRSRHLTPTIRYLMRTRIYIEWGPSDQQQLLFWERLRTALRRPGGSLHLPKTV